MECVGSSTSGAGRMVVGIRSRCAPRDHDVVTILIDMSSSGHDGAGVIVEVVVVVVVIRGFKSEPIGNRPIGKQIRKCIEVMTYRATWWFLQLRRARSGNGIRTGRRPICGSIR